MTAKCVEIIWIILQFGLGFNLFFPLILLLISSIKGKEKHIEKTNLNQIDFAIIVTAYEETSLLPDVIQSILQQHYQNYLVYIVADKCDISNLHFNDDRIFILKPETVIASNTGSHQYAINNFKRAHQYLTIIDSDNIVKNDYLTEILKTILNGFDAIQGLRAAKNLNTTYACLDAARDIYYHYYDGKILFNCGSSATLAGSGMAFKTDLYKTFLKEKQVSGAGFDKVLQAWLVNQHIRIAFNEKAILYDEKTTHSDQLIKQRSRWINTWFKYFRYGFTLTLNGLKNFSINQLLFGLVLLRPPLFMFLIFSLCSIFINLSLGQNYLVWVGGLFCFIFSFFWALIQSNTDQKIYSSLINIPKFVFFQLISLSNVKRANKISVATKHTKIL